MIWVVAWGFAGFSFVILTILVFYRLIANHMTRNDKRRSAELLAIVLDYLQNENAVFRDDEINARERLMMIGMIESLARLIRGEEITRLIALLRHLGAVDAAIKRLSVGGVQEREKTAEMLGNFMDSDAVAALTRALDDRAPRVRLAAAMALIRCGAAPSLRRMITALAGSGLRTRRLRALFRDLVAADPAEAVAAALERQETEVQVLILDALGGTGDYGALPALRVAVRDSDLDVRAAAFRSLSRLAHPSAEECVLEGLFDSEWPVRAQAALCAGKIGLVSTIPSLVHLLGDEQWWVRFRAAEALFDLGEEGRGILTLAARSDTATSDAARLILAERGGAA